jgi:hypothetical protein
MQLRGWVLGLGLWLVGLAPGSGARAAELTVTASAACSPKASIEAQVERLTERSLAQVDGVDFELRIERVAAEDWRLTLRMLSRDGTRRPRRRELAGASCADVTAAAAVAIAMAIEGRDDAAEDETPVRLPQIAHDGAAQPNATRSETRTPASIEGTLAPAATSEQAAWRFAVAAGGALDVGALPALAAGGELELSASSRVLRIAAFGTLFAAQETRVASSGHGGEFRFALGGALLCAQPRFGRVFVLGCTGFELGRLAAEGRGVNAPDLRGAGWYAVRLEAGPGVELGAGFALLARAGIALPLARPEFVLNGSEVVHRPSAVAGRGLLLLELAF